MVHIYTRVIDFSKNYRNVIVLPAAVAMLLERRKGPCQLRDIDDDNDNQRPMQFTTTLIC